VLGLVAQTTSLDTGLVVLAAGLIVGGAATLPLSLPRPGEIDVTPSEGIPISDVYQGVAGPVLVVASYDVQTGSEEAFIGLSGALQRARRRTGAIEWKLFSDESVSGRYIETFLVGSWEEHERQHARATEQDSALLRRIDELLVPGTHRSARHYVAATAPGRRR
jgi:hypothetical protein